MLCLGIRSDCGAQIHTSSLHVRWIMQPCNHNSMQTTYYFLWASSFLPPPQVASVPIYGPSSQVASPEAQHGDSGAYAESLRAYSTRRAATFNEQHETDMPSLLCLYHRAARYGRQEPCWSDSLCHRLAHNHLGLGALLGHRSRRDVVGYTRCRHESTGSCKWSRRARQLLCTGSLRQIDADKSRHTENNNESGGLYRTHPDLGHTYNCRGRLVNRGTSRCNRRAAGQGHPRSRLKIRAALWLKIKRSYRTWSDLLRVPTYSPSSPAASPETQAARYGYSSANAESLRACFAFRALTFNE